jgi:hypothetical protein
MKRLFVLKVIAMAAVLAVVTVYLPSLPAEGARRPNGVADRTSLLQVGGVLRRGDGPWRVYDPHHAHTGIGGLSCDKSGVLHIYFEEVGIQTGFGSLTGDESTASEAITMGVSGSRDELRVYFYRGTTSDGDAKRLSCASSRFKDTGMNLWLSWTQVMALSAPDQ